MVQFKKVGKTSRRWEKKNIIVIFPIDTLPAGRGGKMKSKLRYIMLALVKKPHIELSLQGENVEELIDWIKKKFDVSILVSGQSDSLPVEETDFWKEMQSNRVGNLLAGSRLKAGLTQAQLAKKLGVRQNMISGYERGQRRLSSSMAERIAKLLYIKVDRLS